jgi:hypothetical protein
LPLNLAIENESAVRWIDGGGLAIDQPTVIKSMGIADKIIDSVGSTNAITIEAWLKPSSTYQSGPARIVSVSSTPYYRNFTLGQAADSYDVRLRTTQTSVNGMPSISSSAGSLSTGLTHVVYSRDASGIRKIYINGELNSSGIVDGDLFNWEDYFLLLGNEATEDRPWLGELYLVAIFDHALNDEQITKNFNAGPGF